MFIPDYIQTILKIALVVTVLFGMIFVMLGIDHVTHIDDSISNDDTDKLKDEIKDKPSVISSRSVFHNFLARSASQSSDQKGNE